jgi:hypothetical protein
LYIVEYRDFNDNRYYVPITVYTSHLLKYLSIDFLIDTGAARTQISWNDAHINGIAIRLLPKDNAVFSGIGVGSIQGYNLPDSKLYFDTNFGVKSLPAGNLSVMDFRTTDDKNCPPSRSMLGTDILRHFDILFEETEVFLRKQY